MQVCTFCYVLATLSMSMFNHHPFIHVDIAMQDFHPLALGATPVQVYINGILQSTTIMSLSHGPGTLQTQCIHVF
jgi:hypothetical protein